MLELGIGINSEREFRGGEEGELPITADLYPMDHGNAFEIGLDKFLEGEHTGDVVPEDEVEVHVDERLDVVSPPVWLPRHRERQRRAKLPRSLDKQAVSEKKSRKKVAGK